MSDKPIKAGLVLPELGDDPYSRGPFLGLERAVRELGIKGRVLTPAPREGYAPSLGVFQVAGHCGLGALEAAREHEIWGIGVDVDQSHLGPHMLTSAVKSLDVAVFDNVERLLDGTVATGGTSVYSLKDGGVGLGAISPDVPSSVVAEIERAKAQIIAGAIAVPTTVT